MTLPQMMLFGANTSMMNASPDAHQTRERPEDEAEGSPPFGA
jgi:hypothetical protein